jgi:hypothetical protein
MKNITFSASEQLIDEARETARQRNTTLNEEFRNWLLDYSGRNERKERALRTLEKLQKTVKTKGPYTREEMNER